MDWKKKLKIPVLTFIILCAMLLIGYAVWYHDSNSAGSSGDAEKSTKSAKSKPVNLTLFSDISDWNAPEWSLRDGTLTKAISDHSDVSLTFNIPAQDADKELSLLLVENKLPDIITVRDSNIIRQLISSGKVWNLREFFLEYKSDSDILKNIPEGTLSDLMYRDDGWYALPTGYRDDDFKENNNTIIWNKALLEKIGINISDVKTESGMLSALKKAEDYRTLHHPQMIPILFDGTHYKDGSLTFMAYSFGASELDSKGRYQNIWTTQGGKEALDFTNTLLETGILNPSYLAYDLPQIQKMMAESSVLCYIGNINELDIDFDNWVSSGAVRSDTGAAPVLQNLSSSSYTLPNTFVSKSCNDLPGTAKLLDYVIGGKMLDDVTNDSQVIPFAVFSNPMWDRTLIGQSYINSNHYKKLHKLRGVYSKEPGLKTYDPRLLTLPVGMFKNHQKLEDNYNSIFEDTTDFISDILSAQSKGEFKKLYSEMLENYSSLRNNDLGNALNSQIEKNRKEFNTSANRKKSSAKK
ncbi:MAG: hypothetical protein FRC54_04795 [bacterium LCO1.1]|uniref:Extracellular solute-binding protein n=1 Tax=Candidatus Weimeria bifida TaxID=2599074 RepID=A0A6N7IYB5_9FIRM|nr:hypothetical protein [Candidatus Weimeria bifida]